MRRSAGTMAGVTPHFLPVIAALLSVNAAGELCAVHRSQATVNISCSGRTYTGGVAWKDLALRLHQHLRAGASLSLDASFSHGTCIIIHELVEVLPELPLATLSVDLSHSDFWECPSRNFGRFSRLLDWLLWSLAGYERLTSLTFKLAGMGPTGSEVASLGHGLGNMSNLQELSLDLSGLHIRSTTGDATPCLGGALSLAFSRLSRLQSLELMLAVSGISDADIWELGAGLSRLKTLYQLDLVVVNNQIGNFGARELAKAVSSLMGLTFLRMDLSYNQVGAVGATDLGQEIGRLAKLESLRISLKDNNVGFSGVSSLIVGLAPLSAASSAKPRSLALDFTSNGITSTNQNVGTKSLGKALSTLQGFRLLDLDFSGNPLEPAVVGDAVEGLKHLKAATYLRASGLDFPTVGMPREVTKTRSQVMLRQRSDTNTMSSSTAAESPLPNDATARGGSDVFQTVSDMLFNATGVGKATPNAVSGISFFNVLFQIIRFCLVCAFLVAGGFYGWARLKQRGGSFASAARSLHGTLSAAATSSTAAAPSGEVSLTATAEEERE
mmetsp:Transcript_121052/g.235656  ORF Transcript_121052/g.235656 Transcript_121052/m.235656 type:complete len:555 (-) Transcript_121052:197-1861(-)